MARPKKGKEKNRSDRMSFHTHPVVRKYVELDVRTRGDDASIGDVLNDILMKHYKIKKSEIAA